MKQEQLWRTGTEVLPISEMSDKHLVNSILYLEELWPKYDSLLREFVSRRLKPVVSNRRKWRARKGRRLSK